MDIGMIGILRPLKASDGMILTNGNVYSKEIYLGINDSPDNWREITDEEYAEMERLREEIILSISARSQTVMSPGMVFLRAAIAFPYLTAASMVPWAIRA